MKIVNKKMVYIIMIATIVFGLLLAWSISFVIQTKDNIDIETKVHLEEISSRNVELVTSKMRSIVSSVESIAYSISNKDAIKDVPDIISNLEETNKFYNFKRIGIILAGNIDENGKFIKEDYVDRNSKLFIKYTDDVVVDASNATYGYLAFEGKSNISESFVDIYDENKERINIFCAPIYDQGKVVGAVAVVENVSSFSKYLRLESFNKTGLHFIANKEGIIVISDGRNSFASGDDFKKQFVNNMKITQEVYDEFRANMLRGASGSFVAIHHNDNFNISYDCIGINGWYSIRIVSQKMIANGTTKLAERITMIIALAFSLAIALMILVTILDKTNSKKLENMAYLDAATGHYNWRKFKLEGEKKIKENPFNHYCLIAMDIDKFKVINDMYGHEKGNEVLKRIINYLDESATRNEIFARVSGDNFNLLAEYVDEESIINRVNKISSHLINYIDGYFIEISFGIYFVENIDMPIDIMSDRASLAKSTIKNNPNIKYAFFNSDLRDKIIEEKELENDMENALINGEILVYLQPKFSFLTDKVVGAEALARWNHPTKGLLLPSKFVPLFERNGFIKKLDVYMFQNVCKLLARWEKELPCFNNIVISVNFSRVHVSNPLLTNQLLDCCMEHNLDTERIEIEITENTLFNDIDQIKEFMKKIKEKGFLLSIDDFGAGYSSLNALMEIPADIIKLDKGFLNEATVSTKGRNIIISLIGMIKSLGLITVAEGVEYAEQADFLKANLCDIAQGFLYAKPMPISEFEELTEKLDYTSKHVNLS